MYTHLWLLWGRKERFILNNSALVGSLVPARKKLLFIKPIDFFHAKAYLENQRIFSLARSHDELHCSTCDGNVLVTAGLPVNIFGRIFWEREHILSLRKSGKEVGYISLVGSMLMVGLEGKGVEEIKLGFPLWQNSNYINYRLKSDFTKIDLEIFDEMRSEELLCVIYFVFLLLALSPINPTPA